MQESWHETEQSAYNILNGVCEPNQLNQGVVR